MKAEVIGDGDIATALKEIELKDMTYFASGVSNSQEKRESEYQREIDLLSEQNRNRHLVYFGSLAIFYSDTRYARHKREMEVLVQKQFPRNTIFRIGNITWGRNPHILVNAMRAKIERGEPLEIRDTTRYMLDKKEFHHWVRLIPDWSCEMNVTGRLMTVRQVMKEYVL